RDRRRRLAATAFCSVVGRLDRPRLRHTRQLGGARTRGAGLDHAGEPGSAGGTARPGRWGDAVTARHFLSRLFDEPRAWLEFVVVRWPESPSGGVLRCAYWRWRLGCPRDCGFGRGVVVDSPALTRVGRNTSFSSETIISASDSAGIYIGDNVITGPRCLLRAGNHRIDRLDIPIRDQGHVYQELDYNGRTYSIVIEDDVWLGANVIVLSGAW